MLSAIPAHLDTISTMISQLCFLKNYIWTMIYPLRYLNCDISNMFLNYDFTTMILTMITDGQVSGNLLLVSNASPTVSKKHCTQLVWQFFTPSLLVTWKSFLGQHSSALKCSIFMNLLVFLTMSSIITNFSDLSAITLVLIAAIFTFVWSN